MSVVGAAMSDYVEPDATDQRSLREFMCWTSEGYVMIHIVHIVVMSLRQPGLAKTMRLIVSAAQNVMSKWIGGAGIEQMMSHSA